MRAYGKEVTIEALCLSVCALTALAQDPGNGTGFHYTNPSFATTQSQLTRGNRSDRGFHFNNLSISPFVNLEYEYNNNVDYDKEKYKDSSFSLNPGIDLKYAGNNWGLEGSAWYGYEWFNKYDELNKNRYGENLRFYKESEKGWRLVLGESYLRSEENDSILDGGRGIWRDRETLELTGALSYQLGEKTGITLSGMYSHLDYKRNNNKYAPLYGWDEWSAELEFSRKLTEKTNLLLAGGVQSYESDGTSSGVNEQSTGYSLMAGLGSRATEKISYRALTGVSFFDYANNDSKAGWTYSVDMNWVINKQWGLSIAGSSYYQPSEREQNQANKIYSLSSGLTYRPFRKLTTSADLAYRREETEYAHTRVSDGQHEDTISGRLGANYLLMRYATIYTNLEYDKRLSDVDDYEFDCFRWILGMRLFY